MKKLIAIILIMFAFHADGQQIKQQHPYRVIRTLTADLNNDGKTDTIRLISSLEGRNDFNKISISLTGYGKSVFKARDYWTALDSFFLLKNKNTIHTKLLFLKSTPVHSAILLFGILDGAGYRGEFSIINIENNHVKMVFDAMGEGTPEPDIEWPVELTDLKHDEWLCFVYTMIHEFDGFSSNKLRDKGLPDVGAYTPYLVYPVTDDCHMDEPLSKEYMEKYSVFAGYEYSEKIEEVYPRDGSKPRIWKKPVKH